MRVGADHDLPRQRVLLGQQRMTNAFGSLLSFELAVRARSVALGELPMRRMQLVHDRHEIVAHVGKALRRQDEMVLDGDDLVRSLELDVGSERIGNEVRAHAREVVVREAPVGGDEHALAWCQVVRRCHLAPRDDLVDQRARTVVVRRRRDVHAADARQLRLAVFQEAAGADHLLRHFVAAGEERVERNRLPRRDAREDREVGRGQDADVVGVLAVDALEALGHDEADTRRLLGKRTGLARRSLAVALAGHHDRKAAVTHRVDADRHLAADLEPDVRVASQALVVVKADGGRRDLVGGDVVAQRHAIGQREILAAQLAAYGVQVLRQKEHPAREADLGVHGTLNPVARAR